MNDDAMKWVTELEKAAKIRTPVGATYAVALALMHVASAIEKHTAAIAEKRLYLGDADLGPNRAKK